MEGKAVENRSQDQDEQKSVGCSAAGAHWSLTSWTGKDRNEKNGRSGFETFAFAGLSLFCLLSGCLCDRTGSPCALIPGIPLVLFTPCVCISHRRCALTHHEIPLLRSFPVLILHAERTEQQSRATKGKRHLPPHALSSVLCPSCCERDRESDCRAISFPKTWTKK